MEEQYSLEKLVENVKGKKVINNKLIVVFEKIVLNASGYDKFTDIKNYCNICGFEREARVVLKALEENGYETYELRKRLNDIESKLEYSFMSSNEQKCIKQCCNYKCCRDDVFYYEEGAQKWQVENK